MSRANTRDLVGSVAIAANLRPKTLLCDKLYRIQLDERKALPSFVSLWLQTRAARDQVELEATGASDSMQNVGQDTVRRIVIPLPTIGQQHEFVDRCDSERARIGEVVAAIQKQLVRLDDQRRALIAATVTGERRVPDDS
jgi:type I restriction enzyme S subunit